MLSTINQLSQKYEKKHGCRPNLLYLNAESLKTLQEQLCEPHLNTISQLLGMEIILVQDLKEPYVSWAQISWKHKSIA